MATTSALSRFVVLSLLICGLAGFGHANPWHYNAAANVLSNAVWRFSVTRSGTSLTLTTRQDGSGDVDLTDCFADTGYRVVTLGSSLFKKAPITQFVGPDVTVANASAFQECSSLTNVLFSPDFKQFGNHVLYKCALLQTFSPTNMTKLTSSGYHVFNGTSRLSLGFSFPLLTSLPEGFFCNSAVVSVHAPAAKTIVLSAFSGSSIASIEVSADLTTIGKQAFLSCKKLKSFTPTELPKLTSVGEAAFSGCSILEGNWIWGALASIPKEAFSSVSRITSFQAPNVKSIGNYAFKSCSSLERVEVSDALSSIGTQAFLSCTKLSEFSPTVLTNLSSTGSAAFSGCSTLGGDWAAPKLTSIASEFFTSTRLSSFMAPKMSTVGDHAFRYCNQMEHLVMKGGGSIGAYAFQNFKASAVIDYLGDAGPSSIGTGAFIPLNSSAYVRVYLKRHFAIPGWAAYYTPVASLDNSVKTRSDFPGKRTLGLYAASQSKAWVVDGDLNQQTIFSIR